MPSQHNQQYSEGILQLRNPNKEVINFILNQVRKRSDIFIAKQVNVKNGIDFYLSSRRFLQSLGKKLQKQFGGELKTSAKLHTLNRLTSKNVYRVNVLFRLPKFKEGALIKYRGEQLKILKIGKKVLCKNIRTGKKKSLNYKDINLFSFLISVFFDYCA